MATILKYEDLEIWQEARVVCKDVFELCQKDKFSKDFSLKDQIRRSTGSCMDNIAEGFDRNGNKEFIHFLSISKGSIAESKSQLYRALDFRYIDNTEFEQLSIKMNSLQKRIGGFMPYLKNSEHKGLKYKEPIEQYDSSEPLTINNQPNK